MGLRITFLSEKISPRTPPKGVRDLKKLFLLFLYFAVCCWFAFGQNMAGVEFSIRFFDKAIYFPDSHIYVKAEIYNNSPETFRFKVSPERVFNLDFEVSTIANKQLEHSQEFIIDRSSDQPVLYREYSLEPGERYAVVEVLNSYILVEKPGMYVVRGKYFPELSVDGMSPVLLSNMLTLSVQPGSADVGPAVVIDRDTGMVLQQQEIPPDEVITYMLSARQLSDWDKFFLYIDIEGLYLQDRGREESYNRQFSDAERRAAINTYRESLKNATTEEGFLLIPSEFRIQKTSYTPDEATVIVIEKFAYTDYTEVKQYTYYLNRRDRIWMMYNYELKNLRTE